MAFYQAQPAVWASWLQACPSSVAPAGGTAAPLRLRGLTAPTPHLWTQAQGWRRLSWVMLIPQIQAAIPMPSISRVWSCGWRTQGAAEKKKKDLFYQRASKGTWFLLNIKKGSKMATVQVV